MHYEEIFIRQNILETFKCNFHAIISRILSKKYFFDPLKVTSMLRFVLLSFILSFSEFNILNSFSHSSFNSFNV